MTDERPPTRAERLLDRVNPILVREIQQSFNGRIFAIVLSLSLVCVTLVAMTVAPTDGTNPSAGRTAFMAVLFALTPILLFVVPFQAFLSTRHEVSGGTAEHLLLTRLRPSVIVRGKLYAAMAQFVLYLSLFAPVAALTYLLRGVDVPTILVLLGMAFLLCLGATAVSIALGASSSQATLRALPYGFAALGLGGLTLAVLGALGPILWATASIVREEAVGRFVAGIGGPVLALLVLSCMGAASFFAHPYENRSSGFRVLAVLGLLLGFAWTWYVSDGEDPRELGSVLATAATGIGFFFWLFAVTEEEALSPRMKTLVPRNRWLALLVAPFLPGGGRGLLFTCLLAALALGGAVLYPLLADDAAPRGHHLRIAATLWAYTLVFAAFARLLRGFLGPGPRRTLLGRLLVPCTMATGIFAPLLFDAFLGRRVGTWHWGHLFNPLVRHVWSTHPGRGLQILTALSVIAAVLLACNLAAIARGVHEVLAASRERRRAA